MNQDEQRRTARASQLLRAFAAVTLAALLVAPIDAPASEDGRAERLYSKALGLLHAGDEAAAMALFHQAVETDPDDPLARYYRGVALGRAERFAEAVSDLSQTAATRPSLPRVRLELGFALMKSGRHDEAAPHLGAACENAETAAEACLLAGVNEVRRGRSAEATRLLSQAVTADPAIAVPARYYQGLAAYRSGDLPAAADNFDYVVKNAPGTDMAREAESFLARIDERLIPSYTLHAGLAFEYDDNVALAPSDGELAEDVFGITDESDGRAVLRLGGAYAVHTSEKAHVSVSYDFLQSLHFELSEFDIQTHTAGGQVAFFNGPATFGLTGKYAYSFLDTESFLGEATVLPWVRIDEGDFGATELYGRVRRRDFILDPFDAQRDALNTAAGIRQFFSLGGAGRYVSLGYRYDRDDADNTVGERFNYDGHQFEVGGGWRFDGELTIDALYAFKFEDYASGSEGREDEEQDIVVKVRKRLGRLVWATASWVTRINDSNQAVYDYDRNIASLGVELRY